MEPLRARVRNGRLVMDEPTELPEGTEVQILDLEVVGDSSPDMDPEERAALERALEESEEDFKAGRFRDAFEFLDELKARNEAHYQPARGGRDRQNK